MKQFVVIGCGRFGRACSMELSKNGHEVLLIDNNEDTVDEMSKIVTHAVYVENLTETSLGSLGLGNFDVAIVAISSNFEAAVLSTVICKNLGVKKVISKAKDKIHSDILLKVGADRTVIPEYESAIRLARSLISDQIFDFIEFAEDYSIAEIFPKDEWIGKSFIDVDMRSNYGINVVAVKSRGIMNINPDPDYIIKRNDDLVVIGSNEDLKKIIDDEGDNLYRE
ncbi:MAG: TrkA family potassium uptake protein [Finegoldia sp.]|nr:TrkA family potassium uptake protein [Finegoldia sp.]